MRNLLVAAVVSALVVLGTASAQAATEQAKYVAINKGLVYLATSQTTSGAEGYWSYANNGTLAATASAALAFIEEGYLPGNDVKIDLTDDGIDNPVDYGDVVGKACNYVFNRATADTRFGWEMPTSGPPTGPTDTSYAHHAEDYNFNGVLDDGGNNQAIFFNPASSTRNVYTTGICAPVVYALGEALGPTTQVGMGSTTVQNMTYEAVMQDVVDWYSWGQVEPNKSQYRGGWRYDANYTSSDNSTAQWGALPMLYGNDPGWNVSHPAFVENELRLWTNYVQNANGGSGYDHPNQYVNMSKTGGLLLELAVLGDGIGDTTVDNALAFINGRWNNGLSSTWYGNKGHPYAMWAVYKALEVYGFTAINNNGTPGDTTDDFLVGNGMSNAAGGITIGQDWGPQTSLAGDWFSDYCDWIVNQQLAGGNWQQLIGNNYWYGPMQAGWYINILNAAGAPPPTVVIPEPVTMAGLALGLGGLITYVRRRRR